MSKVYAALSLALIACSAGCRATHPHRMPAGPVPDFELSALDGGSVRLSDLRGRPVVVAFFAYG